MFKASYSSCNLDGKTLLHKGKDPSACWCLNPDYYVHSSQGTANTSSRSCKAVGCRELPTAGWQVRSCLETWDEGVNLKLRGVQVTPRALHRCLPWQGPEGNVFICVCKSEKVNMFNGHCMQSEIYRRYLQEMLQVYFLKNRSFSFSSQVRFLAILISMLSSGFFPHNLYFSLREVSELDVLPQLGTYRMEWYGWSCLVLVTFTFLFQHHDDIDLHSLNFCSTPQPFSTQPPVILHFVLPFLNSTFSSSMHINSAILLIPLHLLTMMSIIQLIYENTESARPEQNSPSNLFSETWVWFCGRR